MHLRNTFLPVLLVLLSLYSCNSDNHPDSRPNVIVILTDDQGWGDFSLHGNTNLETPNIDQLANEGAQLENFHVCAVCSPTRAEFLTGRYYFRGGVYNTGGGGERLDADELTISEVFKEAGYRTAAYGKWHNGMQYPYHPNARDFEEYYGFCSGHWGHYFDPMLEHNGQIVKGEGFIIDDLTTRGMEFMEDHSSEPFFIYMAYNTPHDPLQVPDKWWDLYKDREITMFSDAYQPDQLGNDIDAGSPQPKSPKPKHEDLQQTRAALALCANIDWNVGRITQKLDELGLSENTIVLYFNDNGPNHWRWNGGMAGKKGSTDEGGVRSPLFVRWPQKIEPGGQIPDLMSVTDLFPTLTDLCGIEDSQKTIAKRQTHPLDGQSMAGVLTGEAHTYFESQEAPLNDANLSCTPLGEDRFILNLWANRISIRSQEYRLSNQDQLYHIPSDPGQKTDLSGQLPERFAHMQAIAQDFRRQIDKEQVTQNPADPDPRPFYLGYPGAKFTQMPARDARAHGNITRSNRWPNCSYFTNWSSPSDSLSWKVTVPTDGHFRVQLYYTCPEGDQGSEIQLSFHHQNSSKSTSQGTSQDASQGTSQSTSQGTSQSTSQGTSQSTSQSISILNSQIVEAHDPPLAGAEKDRFVRDVSFVKDWKILDMGTIEFKEGVGMLSLKATSMPGSSVMDFRLLQFERL